jgi:glycosyltransferase involved in cell wall biosynthesis
MVSIGIITPTIGRQSLRTMLDRLLPQLDEQDRVMIVGDGPQPVAKAIVDSLSSSLIRYSEHGPILNYGNPQRNLAIAASGTDYVMFVDDDDLPTPAAIKAVKAAIAAHPGAPLMFRMQGPFDVLWRAKRVEVCNVSGQMFVIPNEKERIGSWSGRYEADLDFIKSTVALYPGKERAVVWKDDIICKQGYVGRQHGAIELP